MGRLPCSLDLAVRAQAPHTALAIGVLLRARRDVQNGQSISEAERAGLRRWAERAGFTAAVVDPLLDPSPNPAATDDRRDV